MWLVRSSVIARVKKRPSVAALLKMDGQYTFNLFGDFRN